MCLFDSNRVLLIFPFMLPFTDRKILNSWHGHCIQDSRISNVDFGSTIGQKVVKISEVKSSSYSLPFCLFRISFLSGEELNQLVG